MNAIGLVLACLVGGLLWAQPDLFYNQGALVYVQANALVYVQGGMQINDNGSNDGVLENLGTITLVNTSGGWRGNFTIGSGAEVNSRPNSLIQLQGDYHNNDGSHRSTGTHNANGNTLTGGTLEFNASDGVQTFRVTMTGTDPQRWTLNNVVINNTSPIADRHVQIANNTDRDMWINGTLTFTSGRIHTHGASLSNGQPAEVRILNSAANAVVRAPWPPNSTGNFDALLTGNDDRYVYGYLRRNVATGSNYAFPVGGVPTGASARGIQGIDVQPGANHYLRVWFDPTVVAPFPQPPYCRPGDPGASRQYNPLNNGRWQLTPYASVDGTTPSGPSGPSSVTMYNRVVSNAPITGNCPNAGANTGLPGGADPVWTNYPTNLCFVGYNQTSLVPPNNCEGSSSGWTVTRTGFGTYNANGTYFYATVITHNAPLPSDEIRLAAAPAGSAIALTWEVTAEREYVLGYELHRSTDGVNFSRIAQVDKQGRLTYHHRDIYVQPQTRYFYRVEQHDIMGNVRYSNTVEAILPAASESFSVQLHPQPVANEGALLVSVPKDGVLGFEIYDAAGKLVLKNEYSLTAGSHRIELTPVLTRLAFGNYNAVVTFAGEARTIRLIKVEHTN
ncbi:MAG: hypothetical protein NZ989_01045 [Bacteroidia bacterium]|nr:hypothetical protein [Bacteroidia bacterium]MDW8057965.1 hypothetical protein [Bacteroidia bacterium]